VIILHKAFNKLFPNIIVKEAGTYTFINGLSSLFPLLLIPLITRYVDPFDYGVYAVFLVGINLIMPLIGIGIETSSGRKYIDKDTIDFPSYIFSAISLTTILSFVLLLIMYLFSNFLSNYLPISIEWYPHWVIASWSQVIFGLILVINQMRHKPFIFGFWRIGRSTLIYSFFLILIILERSKWENLLNLIFISYTIIAISGLFWLIKKKLIALSISKASVIHIFKYGIPLVPHMLAAAIITATDRIILSNILDEKAVGIYTIGYQSGLVMFIFAQSINRAWTPWFYERLKSKNKEDYLKSTMTLYKISLLFILVGLFLCLSGWIILPYLFGEIYLESVYVFYWIIFAFVVQGLWSLISAYLYYTGETIWISLSSMFASILNIGISILLVTSYGLIGAAQGTFCAYLIALVFLILITLRKAPLPWLLRS